MQGAPLPIAGLADELGVSPTPVREALARLAGEDLVVRTPHGYAALLLDPARVAELYELAGILVCAALQARGMDLASFDLGSPLAAAQATPNRALSRACARVEAQLAPLAAAELQLCGSIAASARALPASASQRSALVRGVRRHFARRAVQSGRILAVALGLIKSPRI